MTTTAYYLIGCIFCIYKFNPKTKSAIWRYSIVIPLIFTVLSFFLSIEEILKWMSFTFGFGRWIASIIIPLLISIPFLYFFFKDKVANNGKPNILGVFISAIVCGLLLFGGGYLKQSKEEFKETLKNKDTESIFSSLGEYDSLVIAGIKIKYPDYYKSQNKGGDKVIGSYTLINQHTKDKVIIGYYPDENARSEVHSSINGVFNNYKNIYRHLKKKYQTTLSFSNIKSKKINGRQVKYMVIQIGNIKQYAYVIQENNHIFCFVAREKEFLNSLIGSIEKCKDTMQISKVNETNKTKDTYQYTSDSKTVKSVMVNKLKFPIYDWEIMKNLNLGGKLRVLVLRNSYHLSIMVMSHKKTGYLETLKKYAIHRNNRLVKNMEPDFILISKGRKNGKFHGINSITGLFTSYYMPTGEKKEMKTVSIKIDNYYYFITYTVDEKTKKVINNIEISKP